MVGEGGGVIEKIGWGLWTAYSGRGIFWISVWEKRRFFGLFPIVPLFKILEFWLSHIFLGVETS
jgi:hypothetical protein